MGQDVHVVFAMFSQSNTGVYLFREISVGHFRSHCRPLAQTFGAHPQAVTSHPRPHFPACNPPSLIQFSTNKACCLLTPLPRLAEKAHRLGKHNSHSHGGNSHCPWLVWCVKLSQVRAHSDFPDFCFRLLCSWLPALPISHSLLLSGTISFTLISLSTVGLVLRRLILRF